MSEKENAALDAANIENGKANVITNKDCTPQEAARQFKIMNLLPVGEEHAMQTKELLALTGYASARTLQTAIQAERNAGALILSRTNGGYFRPAEGEQGREEIKRFIRTLDARSRSTQFTLKAARDFLRRMDGQQMLPL